MITRSLWAGLGLVSTGLAIAGAVLPLVPTTPLLLVAAYAFARSSQAGLALGSALSEARSVMP